ncbi:hypothetical protein AJ80_03766 [Polytolypa hystricis UAMH7299]|uniref:DnaJ homologue subfamily C member 28 conserved domain-containing protein n=1 Tax=Polytolypa hystricis (strain UAMH7299) TaxID=1447883 RepID=A0A2B7YFJ7_POLH7|nr:hypothetical protein AJ80_03766 [Polytolypa hystricis UAMH7299]
MRGRAIVVSNACASCLAAKRLLAFHTYRSLAARSFSASHTVHSKKDPPSSSEPQRDDKDEGKNDNKPDTPKEGAMSRRLSEMTEQSFAEGGKSARKNIQEAGFSEELKKQLEERITASSFKSQNAAAFSLVNMPASAGRGTQDIAAAAPWTGTESIHDVSLRMLNDASKPIRVPFKSPNLQPINLQPSAKSSRSSGQRLASARERTSTYEMSQDSNMSEKQREALRKELQERFTPGARQMPGTLQGLSSLANELIEDAIAQGKFRDVKRGKGVGIERDHTANNPYLDTTEYFLNRMIQRQDIAPPWIEKQQEVAREVERFRRRLRSDWRRHAARLIASEGGALQSQVRRAQAYAAAEARYAQANNNGTSQEQAKAAADLEYRTQIDHEGRITRIDQAASESSDVTASPTSFPNKPEAKKESTAAPLPYLSPLRDEAYLSLEKGYHELTIKTLNALTRSYNLAAPQVSQKPYLNLDRELASCYADVAPSLPGEIHRRATERSHESRVEAPQRTNEGLLQRFAPKQTIPIHEEDASKRYGLKEFWRDLWGGAENRHAG